MVGLFKLRSLFKACYFHCCTTCSVYLADVLQYPFCFGEYSLYLWKVLALDWFISLSYSFWLSPKSKNPSLISLKSFLRFLTPESTDIWMLLSAMLSVQFEGLSLISAKVLFGSKLNWFGALASFLSLNESPNRDKSYWFSLPTMAPLGKFLGISMGSSSPTSLGFLIKELGVCYLEYRIEFYL